MPLDHRRVAAAPVGAERRPDGQRARAPRHLRRQVAEDRPVGLLAAEVRRRGRERAVVDLRVVDERRAAVVRHVQPLVPVDADRVRALDPRDQRARRRARRPRRGRTRRPRAATRRTARPGRPARDAGRTRRCSRRPRWRADRRLAVEARPAAASSASSGPTRRGERRCLSADPSIATALSALTCTSPSRGPDRGSAARPSSSTSTPCRRPHQRRAAARPVKFAIVAPVVSTPLHAGRKAEELLQPVQRDLLDPHRERRADPVERDLVERARRASRRRARPASLRP